jgi:hypothetical protein
MDHTHLHWSSLAHATFSKRICELSKNLGTRTRLALSQCRLRLATRNLRTVILFLFSIACGIAAQRINQEENELSWQSSHQPSRKIWQSSLQAEGLTQVSDNKLRDHFSRSLPLLTPGSKVAVWKAEPDWWAVLGGENTEGPEIFCLSCDLKTAPKNWSPLAPGWGGWEQAMTQVSQSIKTRLKVQKTRPNAAKKSEFLDPREIRY